ncbi:MAG: cation:proton antiporter [Lachnospiraceae bacterium]|nr:cation:proton antiporter [Lachnospiraceae bacterium]
MLLSIALIILSGLLLGNICKKLRFPSLFGMIIAGIIIGPSVFNLIDPSILSISSEIRRIALIIILIRAGLKLDLSDLRKVGRPAILMCFLPACFEIGGMVMLAPILFDMNRLDAAILGAVIGAVSPAVIVPRMIKLIDEGYGTKKGIPQMILAGASVDDVFVIVMFTTFTGLAQGRDVSVMSFINIPISILFGIIIGALLGFILYKFFLITNMRRIIMSVILLSCSFILSAFETELSYIPFASLIAIMCMGIVIRQSDKDMAVKLSGQYDKLWTVAEIFLFVLLGASVAVDYLKEAGANAIILVLLVLLFRMAGVYICMIGTGLTLKEKVFCMVAYTPKATVQAAIGGLPLAMGLSCGELVLTVSVVAILLTAPLGAFGIDMTYKKYL